MKTLPKSAAFAVAAAILPAALGAQAPLPLGKTAEASLSGGSIEYAFSAKEAGFLAVVVRSSGGEDLALKVTDAEGQVLPDGSSDMDMNGSVGAEQLLLAIPSAGEYAVEVRCYDESASFRLSATFLPSALAAVPDDADGRPSGAVELTVGANHDDALDPAAGDRADWYRIRVDRSGVLTVLTRAEGEGDLRLERYIEPEFGEPEDSADEDRDGVMGNESLTLDVEAGDVVIIKVVPSFAGSTAVSYRISSGLIAG
ncbi:MAG TPA: hypothetical protein VLH75_14600 [Longimicrobiales bacterium]|nr:hypothetical protein [Longimicrobiales bacterium]